MKWGTRIVVLINKTYCTLEPGLIHYLKLWKLSVCKFNSIISDNSVPVFFCKHIYCLSFSMQLIKRFTPVFFSLAVNFLVDIYKYMSYLCQKHIFTWNDSELCISVILIHVHLHLDSYITWMDWFRLKTSMHSQVYLCNSKFHE